MHDGLDGDDIYMMVEDEFYAVAKTFTQHLHHAEYLRLKNLTESRTASTASTISRPIDSITTMRNETKKKIQAETRDARTKIALEQIKGAKRPASDDSGLSDADNGYWRGTALQGLMKVSSTKNQTSLAGLQGVKSSTRAAAGYSKAESKPSHPRARAIDLRPSASNSTHSKPALPEGLNLEDSSTDDLDAPPARPHPRASNPPPRVPAPRTLKSSPPPKIPPPPRLPNPASSRPKSRQTPQSYPTPDSDSDSNNFNSDSSPGLRSGDRTRAPVRAQNQAARTRLKARMARREIENAKGVGGGGTGGGGGLANVNEIPVFLV